MVLEGDSLERVIGFDLVPQLLGAGVAGLGGGRASWGKVFLVAGLALFVPLCNECSIPLAFR